MPLVDRRHREAEVADSAYQRQRKHSLEDGRYRPTRTLGDGESATVEVPAAEGWTATGLYFEPGEYQVAADGGWRSDGVVVGPVIRESP